MDQVTCLNGLNKFDGATHPVFKGGFDWGVNVTLPSSLTPLKTAAQTGGKHYTGARTFLEFLSDGKIRWRQRGSDDRSNGVWTIDDVTTLASKCAIWVEGHDAHVKGVVKGKLTAGTSKDIWIDDDVTYAEDPRPGPSSDLLGLVIEKNTYHRQRRKQGSRQ
jgi:hypothetical protein